MLADRHDGVLTSHQLEEFDAHLADCASCTEMVAEAQRGAAWLELLRSPRPEPPAALLERILAQTDPQAMAAAGQDLGGGIAAGLVQVPVSAPAGARMFKFPQPWRSSGVGLQAVLQPRLAMTAAMAFFSIGLTLNLTGVQLNKLRASDLKPSTVRRSLYEANAHVVRYYDNLRVVYELESRVREIQRISDRETPAAQEAPVPPEETKPEKRPAPRSGAGSSRRLAEPAHEGWRVLAVADESFVSQFAKGVTV